MKYLGGSRKIYWNGHFFVSLTQPEMASKAGIGIRFIRRLGKGKQTLRLDKENQVLWLFCYLVGAVIINRGYNLLE